MGVKISQTQKKEEARQEIERNIKALPLYDLKALAEFTALCKRLYKLPATAMLDETTEAELQVWSLLSFAMQNTLHNPRYAKRVNDLYRFCAKQEAAQ